MSKKIVLTEFDKARFNAVVAKKLIIEDYDLFKDYMKMFFFRYGSNIFYFNGLEFELKTLNEIKQQLPIDLCHTVKIANPDTEKFEKITISARNYIETIDFTKDIYEPTIDFSTSLRVIDKITMIRGLKFTDKSLNMAKPFAIDVFNRPKKYPAGTKAGLVLIYDHMLNVINSGNKEASEYFLNWIACTMNGRKLRKAVHMVSSEGTGKGLIVGGLFKNIMGNALFKTSSTESIVKYTKNFEGCAMVNFDELPASENRREISDCMKSLITEGTFACRDMFKSAYEQKNTFNVIDTTNNISSICMTQQNKRRYFVPDVSDHRIGDIVYFTALSKAINNVNVCVNFYWEMVDRFKTLDKFNEDIMPMTDSYKKNIIASLPRFYLYIKEEYILQSKSMKIKPVDLYNEYLLVNKTERQTCKQSIIKIKKDLGFETTKIKGVHHFVYTNKELMKMFKVKDWVDETNDYIDDERDIMIKFYDDDGNEDDNVDDAKIVFKKDRKTPIKANDVNVMDSDEDEDEVIDVIKKTDPDVKDNVIDIIKTDSDVKDKDGEQPHTELTKSDCKELIACFNDSDDEDDEDEDNEDDEDA